MLAIPTTTDGVIPTLNQMGYMNAEPCRITQSFMQYAQEQAQEDANRRVLDIGCAYGVASIPLAQARVAVTACDSDARHLSLLRDGLTEEEQQFVTTVQGTMPHTLNFAASSFQAVLMSLVLHFLTPEEIVQSFQLIFQWLKPGGQFFSATCTPYIGTLLPFRETFDALKAKNHPWPGVIENARKYVPEERKEQLPDYFHVLDVDTLQRIATQANFEVMELFYYGKENDLKGFNLDGREYIGLICRKPL